MATTQPALHTSSSDVQPEGHDVAEIAHAADQISAQNLAQSNAIMNRPSRPVRPAPPPPQAGQQAQVPQAQPAPAQQAQAPLPQRRRPVRPAPPPPQAAQQRRRPVRPAPKPPQHDPHGIDRMKIPAPGTQPRAAHDDDEDGELVETVGEGAELFDGAGEAIEKTGLYIGHRAEEDAKAHEDGAQQGDGHDPGAEGGKSEERDEAKAHTASSLGATASGIGAVTSAVGGIAGLAGFVQNVRRFRKLKEDGDLGWLEGLQLGAEATGNGVAALAGGANTANSSGKMGAEIAASVTGSATAEEVAKAFGGIGGGIGVLSNGAQTLVSGSKVVLGVVKNIHDHREGKETNWSEVGVESIATLKHFLGAAESAITAVNNFLQIAGKAGDFANVVPIVGAVVNISIQMLDIAIQAVHFVKSLVKLIRACIDAQAMRREGTKTADHEEQALFGHVAELNTKRWKRQIVPLVASIVNTLADLVSIGGSVLNIVGTATAPAYGAGVAVMAVGYGLSGTSGLAKLGASLARPIAAVQRTQKQFGRDVKAGEKSGKMATAYDKLHLTGLYNADKSSEHKQKRYLEDIDRLFDMMRALPPYNKAQKPVIAQYDRVHRVVRATGVRPKLLYAQQDQREAVRMLLDAMKKRE